MKRILIALAVAFGAFAACTNKKGTTAKIEGLDFDSIVVDTTVALTNDKDAPRCNVTLSLQFAKGNNADKINNALIHAGIGAYQSKVWHETGGRLVYETLD